MKYLNLLLIFAPIAIIGSFLHMPETWLFVASALAVIPVAGILGRATEELAVHTGPRLGGLLNATLGNAAELIITIFAIRAGLLDLVKASITGSIIGNVLLVMGASLLFGGLKNGVQRFDRTHAGVNATQLLLAVMALLIPSIFFFAHTETTRPGGVAEPGDGGRDARHLRAGLALCVPLHRPRAGACPGGRGRARRQLERQEGDRWSCWPPRCSSPG